MALHAAHDAVQPFGRRVKIVQSICRGEVDVELLKESGHAAMICVGSVGIGHAANWFVGSTAATLAKHARCPVAIIRTEGRPSTERQIVVVVDRHNDSDDVVHHAFEEARLRQTSILALGVWRWNLGPISDAELHRRLAPWTARYPEIAVEMSITGTATEYLVTHNKSVQLVVTGPADANQLSRLVGPSRHPLASYPNCSILLVRNGAPDRTRLDRRQPAGLSSP
jgi:nucleotide-binding universal stress UspA family protein